MPEQNEWTNGTNGTHYNPDYGKQQQYVDSGDYTWTTTQPPKPAPAPTNGYNTATLGDTVREQGIRIHALEEQVAHLASWVHKLLNPNTDGDNE